ncbi:hypothetical protein C8A00DRAFT_14630 [Chaetomidium leptoderma]|uniref:Uncharacterized protein n=1 Tax=Chaetomidium leptoderma TaxID=669021 RepID=A0AAN6ZXV3_9PEZI|nr:hypothetical protein C8A00DRAFT_14630 [Chaetomidium leptoderma]
MCHRKIFVHHRCGHQVTSAIENCESAECPGTMDKPIVSNKYPCVYRTCPYYGKFD